MFSIISVSCLVHLTCIFTFIPICVWWFRLLLTIMQAFFNNHDVLFYLFCIIIKKNIHFSGILIGIFVALSRLWSHRRKKHLMKKRQNIIRKSKKVNLRLVIFKKLILLNFLCKDADPNWSYADPDPPNLVNADPDP